MHQGQVFGGQTRLGRKGPISIRPRLPIIQGCHLKRKPIKPSSAPSATLNKTAWIPHGSIRKEHPGDKPHSTQNPSALLHSPLPGICVGPLLHLTSKVPCSLVCHILGETYHSYSNTTTYTLKVLQSVQTACQIFTFICCTLGKTWKLSVS